MPAKLMVFIFQSTLSMRRATMHTIDTGSMSSEISIHALHEESDP